ncbi:MAG: hypothetical protein EPN82_16090 [Bacteroidetes bacterium]|nr:MAG: hypothetical protein EPN82_16090 [Bacteroidota bacterium]
MLTKELVTKTIHSLPEEFEPEELKDRIILLDKIQQGLKDSEEERTFSEKEASKRLEKWLL